MFSCSSFAVSATFEDVMKRSKLLLALGVLCLCSVAADQTLHHGFMGEGKLLGRRVAPFDPPIFYENQEQAFAKLTGFLETGEPPEESFSFDSELGWCPWPSSTVGGRTFDEWGACVGPATVAIARTQAVRRVITAGCSFTMGYEVGDAETWPYLLDEGDDSLEVVNLAMSAYGLDQAWLRYRRDGRAFEADEVWLGWLPAASLRLGTLYRPVVRHWSGPLLFKPRFRVRGTELQLVENPARSLQEVHRLLSDQDRFLRAMGVDDLWVQRSLAAYSPMGSDWRHHTGFGRAWLTVDESREKSPSAWLERESSSIRELVVRVTCGMRDDVEADGARFRLLVLPDKEGLSSAQENGRAYWSGLVEELMGLGVEVIDLTQAASSMGMLEDSASWAPGGHYSARGNAIIAGELRRIIAD